MIRGVGYKVHPTHCDKFIQCYFDGFGNTRASLKTCPFGEYWDQHNVACVDAQMANCPNGNTYKKRLAIVLMVSWTYGLCLSFTITNSLFTLISKPARGKCVRLLS